MKILFIGILTEIALQQCKTDGLIGSFVSIEDAAEEIGKICNTYNEHFNFNRIPEVKTSTNQQTFKWPLLQEHLQSTYYIP